MGKRLLFFFLPAFLWISQVKAEYYIIRNYHVNVNIDEKGEADFEEILEVEFSEPRHGIIRFIPTRSKLNGKNVNLIIKDVQVDGFNFSTSRENQNFVIKIGDADKYVSGRQVFKIRYHVHNPINFFEDHSEFYWDLVGVSTLTVTEQFTFEVNFPEKVKLSPEHVRFFTGAAGDQQQNGEVQVSPRQIKGRTIEKLMPQEGWTIAVYFPEGAFQKMSSWSQFFLQHTLLLIAPLFVLAGLLGRYIARNRRQTIMTEYFPPPGISPAIAGGFVDHSVDNSDVLCLIPHLANQGYLRMEVQEGGFWKKDHITFYKLKDAGAELFGFERDFFNALFASGDVVELSDLKDKFYTHMASIKASVKEWIRQQGWYEPDQRAMGCTTAILGLGAIVWGALALFKNQNFDGIALGVAGLILFYFASKFNKRTPLGNTTYQKFEGFRQFVKKAERPVIERLLKEDPNYYDKTMPYALAFGYLAQWNNPFQGLLTQPPTWYGAPGMHGAHLNQSWSTFSQSFPTEINSIGSVFSSAPSSSGSGGGGGGGGFSGGGGGGGGTSSW